MQTQLVGILNLTPDSFSDGGAFDALDKAQERVERMITNGASVIDVGAESTRPGAFPLTEEEEWTRLEPFLSWWQKRNPPAKLSIDTRHAATARHALACEADWINDVSGGGEEIVQAVIEAGARYVLMHNLGIPVNPAHSLPTDCDPVEEILHWGKEKIAALTAAGLQKDAIIFDPGIGFGKTARQSAALIHHIGKLHALGVPLFVGHSRKSFLTLITGAPPQERDLETAIITGWLAQQHVPYVRVHDVALSNRALNATALVSEFSIK